MCLPLYRKLDIAGDFLSVSYKTIYENVTEKLPGETNAALCIVVLLWLKQFQFYPKYLIFIIIDDSCS